ncbi:hypothetical protein HK16_00305 [Acetobacter senegalensis]|uniref:Uncharacterized protein n=2 Tax=Acetobacter TaxID=434 RepID=A0A252EF30_9PROT|nr:hypothetical protein CIW82_18875 [Acetobacter tropicalis]OUL64912.1 hypothetical protein HK16_00305 [Acetobacter senegalensis]
MNRDLYAIFLLRIIALSYLVTDEQYAQIIWKIGSSLCPPRKQFSLLLFWVLQLWQVRLHTLRKRLRRQSHLFLSMLMGEQQWQVNLLRKSLMEHYKLQRIPTGIAKECACRT